MAKHIHIHLGRTKDADGPAHAPAGSNKGGQFTSGSSVGRPSGAKAGKKPAAKGNPDFTEEDAKAQLKLHSNLKKQFSALKPVAGKPGLKRMDLNNPSPGNKGAITKAKANGGGSKEQVSSWAARAASESNRN